MISIKNKLKTHFIGIGGIGMSGIAELMHDLGYAIQGSDLINNENTKRLRKKGVKIFIGHKATNIKSAKAVVFSSAIKKTNPEILESKKNKIPLVSRADMLAELMKTKKSIAIAGSHGKTTTTSLVGNILDEAKFDPTIVNGGIINSYSKNNRFGKGSWMVVEADESDGSFLKLPHELSIITNLDIEHLDFYKNKENLFKAFQLFILNLPFYGTSIICLDDKNLKNIAKNISTRNIVTYSMKYKSADIYIEKIKYEKYLTFFKLNLNKSISNYKGTYNYSIKSIGNHNVLNGVASIVAAMIVGVKNNYIKKALSNYVGVKRRFTYLGKLNDAYIYDDYAHHPTEILATLSAANQISHNVVIAFQPHRYSRTNILMKDFVKVLSKIKKLYILKTYSAGEKIIKNATSKALVKKLLENKKEVKYIEKEESLNDLLIQQTKVKSVIIFMGAGSITKIAYKFIKNND